ncbi:uncharacterized protein LOC142347955 [Convolutriloba macropyga]|uniref:uncharacterized protein LOC142347955 n=1 Tax=Convolutriloba macropyga TaxID=536237 RepID=UPI003F524859
MQALQNKTLAALDSNTNALKSLWLQQQSSFLDERASLITPTPDALVISIPTSSEDEKYQRDTSDYEQGAVAEEEEETVYESDEEVKASGLSKIDPNSLLRGVKTFFTGWERKQVYRNVLCGFEYYLRSSSKGLPYDHFYFFFATDHPGRNDNVNITAPHKMEISPSGRMDITIYNLKISTSDFNVYIWRTDVPFGETVLSANPYIGENFNFNDPSRARIPLPLL